MTNTNADVPPATEVEGYINPKRLPGKKAGKLTVRFRRPGGNEVRVTVDLRLDEKGVFYAQYEGKWYKAPLQASIERSIREAADASADIVWVRYLAVRYKAEVRTLRQAADGGSGSYHMYRLTDDRRQLALDYANDGSQPVVSGLSLVWSRVEFSTPYRRPGDHKLVRMRREVDETHDGSEFLGRSSEQDDAALPVGLVRWTAEREAFLREILFALTHLDRRLAVLFGGDEDDLARKIDQASTTKALAGGVFTAIAEPRAAKPRAKTRRA